MKRSREGEVDSISMANCLMLLSRGGDFDSMIHSPSHVFECSTCNRQFPSFQALGGHRASHKKLRLMGGDPNDQTQLQNSPAKPKTHECWICGLEFTIGQALGGHMRRHRASKIENQSPVLASLSPAQIRPIVKKSNSRRVLCLDLNLTPLENDHLEFRLGKVASMYG